MTITDNGFQFSYSTRHRIPLIWGLFIFFAVSLWHEGSLAQERRLSLNDAVRLSMKFNREIQISKLERDKNSESVREAWAAALPNINFSGNFTHSFQSANFFPRRFIDPNLSGFQSLTLSGINSINAGITIQQPIYRGVVYAGIRAAGIVASLSDEGVRQSIAETVTDVKKSYYDVLIASEQVKLLEQSIARSELALSDTRQLFKQGLASDLDTLRAYVAVENLRPSKIKAEAGIEIALTVLKTKIGLSASESLILTDVLDYVGDDRMLNFDLAYQSAVESRPEVKQLELQVEAGEAFIDAEFSNMLPSVDAFAQFQALTLTDNFNLGAADFAGQYAVGLQVTIPIFAGFRNFARVEKAELEKKQTEARLFNAKELIRAEVRVSISNVEESRKRIASQSKTLQSAQRSYDITRSRRQQGLVSLLEVTDAELALAQAKNNYLQSVYDYLVARANLDKSLGMAAQIGMEAMEDFR